MSVLSVRPIKVQCNHHNICRYVDVRAQQSAMNDRNTNGSDSTRRHRAISALPGWLTVTGSLTSATHCAMRIILTITAHDHSLHAETHLINRRRISRIARNTDHQSPIYCGFSDSTASLHLSTELRQRLIHHLPDARCCDCLLQYLLLLAEMTSGRISLIRLDKMDRSCSEL